MISYMSTIFACRNVLSFLPSRTRNYFLGFKNASLIKLLFCNANVLQRCILPTKQLLLWLKMRSARLDIVLLYYSWTQSTLQLIMSQYIFFPYRQNQFGNINFQTFGMLYKRWSRFLQRPTNSSLWTAIRTVPMRQKKGEWSARAESGNTL